MSRELDALVAEKVMGLTVKDYRKTMRQPFFSWCGEYTSIHWAPNDQPYIVVDDDGKAGCPQVKLIDNYSTDIAAAWKVAEKWADDEYKSVEVRYGNGSAYCRFIERGYRSFQDTEWEAWSDTAPLAICLAALKACGVDYPEKESA